MTMAPVRFRSEQLLFFCILLLVSVHVYVWLLHGQVHWFLVRSELGLLGPPAALMAAALEG